MKARPVSHSYIYCTCSVKRTITNGIEMLECHGTFELSKETTVPPLSENKTDGPNNFQVANLMMCHRSSL